MAEKEDYFSEPFTDGLTRHFKVERIIYQGKTAHQSVHIIENKVFGKILFLDGKIQSAQIDEFVFHEALVHPSLFTHPQPQKILVIGGGEGATIREVLKHDVVEKVVMVDIDEELVRLCQEYLPEWSEGSFLDRRAQVNFDDARKYLEQTGEKFDVVISDLTEPVKGGPSVFLFTREFFQRIFQVLDEDGIFVLQAGSTDPFYNEFFASLKKTLEATFPVVRPYRSFIFSFSLPWGFVMGSKKEDPLKLEEEEIARRTEERRVRTLKLYHPGFHRSLFSLPLYLLEVLEKGRVLTDSKPFIWEA